ncbi:MAG TPA: hypothetical protein VD837_06975 [Terriglobales bacterium]|nr:hypothetical protein [Terriglobales bacterium]
MSHYNPNSIDATLSRIETKLDDTLRVQEKHGESINKLWAALGRLDVRVAVISATATAVFFVAKQLIFR